MHFFVLVYKSFWQRKWSYLHFSWQFFFDKIHLRPRGTFLNQVGTHLFAWVRHFNLLIWGCHISKIIQQSYPPTFRVSWKPEAPSATIKLANSNPMGWVLSALLIGYSMRRNLYARIVLWVLQGTGELTQCFESEFLDWSAGNIQNNKSILKYLSFQLTQKVNSLVRFSLTWIYQPKVLGTNPNKPHLFRWACFSFFKIGVLYTYITHQSIGWARNTLEQTINYCVLCHCKLSLPEDVLKTFRK